MRYLIALNLLVSALSIGLLIVVFSGPWPLGLTGPDLVHIVFNMFCTSVVVSFVDLIGLLYLVAHKRWQSAKTLAVFFVVLSVTMVSMFFFVAGQ